MSLSYEEKVLNSPYVETVTCGYTASDGFSIRPAETSWHMVFVRHGGSARLVLVGPWRAAGIASWGEGAEILWLKFKLGTFMPCKPTVALRDAEKVVPEATSSSFWLADRAWPYPNSDDVDAFVDRLVRKGVLARDPLVSAALEGRLRAVSPRTLRHRFLRATGLSQRHIEGVRRAERAAAMLKGGTSIADTAYEAGYFDQPHLARSLKRFVGYTPAQLIRLHQLEPLAVSYKTARAGEVYPT